MTTEAGLAVVDKPQGWTSHQVVGRLRRLLGTRKVGHAGTLDPMATGVLVVGVNRATRLLGHLALHDKRYLATVVLGAATDTDDAEGTVTSAAGAAGVDDAAVAAAMATLTGEIRQVPSSVSAIKVDGKRAYARVRAGETVELAARPVTVSRFDLLASRRVDRDGLTMIELDVDVECSSGTYVRALARDLGAALGVGGHLSALRRTRVGPFDLTAVSVSREALVDDATQVSLLTMADAARLSFPCVDVGPEIAARVRVGQTVSVAVSAPLTALLDPGGELLALYRPDGDVARPVAVLAP